jgi:preprotein translocase subunit SecG
MYIIVLSIHVVLALVLVTLVLLQQGKGADVGAVMGGGSNSLFGAGGASSILVRATTFIAVAFMLTSVLLVKLSAKGGSFAASPADITEGLDISKVQGSVENTGTTETSKPANE